MDRLTRLQQLAELCILEADNSMGSNAHGKRKRCGSDENHPAKRRKLAMARHEKARLVQQVCRQQHENEKVAFQIKEAQKKYDELLLQIQTMQNNFQTRFSVQALSTLEPWRLKEMLVNIHRLLAK